MAIARLTRTIHFSAAHRYHRPEWSDEENRRAFGACNNAHGHGHNYRLEVTVQGAVDPDTGFCVDLGLLDAILDAQVRKPLDHQHLNFAVPEFGYGESIPTCENILLWLWPRLAEALPGGTTLERLVLHEDAHLAVELLAP